MNDNYTDLIKYIRQANDLAAPDFSVEIGKSKGVKRLVKKVSYALTGWIVDAVMNRIRSQNELNAQVFWQTYKYLRELENCTDSHDENLFVHAKLINELYETGKIINRIQHDYNQWIILNEPIESELKIQRGFRHGNSPRICLVLHLNKVNFSDIGDLIYSIKAQTYNNWVFKIIVGDEETKHCIDDKYSDDERIGCINSGDYGSDEYNFAYILSISQDSDYIGFLQPYDTLAPFALFEAVKCINEFPETDIIYGDEDKIKDSTRYEPLYRPGFAPDTLRSTNYIGSTFIVKRNFLSDVVNKMDCSGDLCYEFFLRAMEFKAGFYHIPKIINHVRSIAVEESAIRSGNGGGNGENGEPIEAHIQRHLGMKSTVTYLGVEDLYRVDYEVMQHPGVSIIIPNKDQADLLKTCIDSIRELTTYDNYEIIIIENNSTENETFDYYKEIEETGKAKVIYYTVKEFNYSKIMNFGVKNCTFEYVVQLNNDTRLLTPNWLELMLGFAQRSDVGIVGVKMYYPDMSIQHAGGILIKGDAVSDHVYRFMPKTAKSYGNRDLIIQNISWVTGACMMFRKEVYEIVGCMSEDFAVSFGDSDLCMKMQAAGKFIVYNPYVELIHYEGETRGRNENPEDVVVFLKEKEMFMNKWRNELERGDLYFSPDMEKVLF